MLLGRYRDIRHYLNRFKSSSVVLEKIRQKLENGPNFQDFIQNSENSKKDLHGISNYDGKLKKEKNENTRLRLPPWLKTTIPIGDKITI